MPKLFPTQTRTNHLTIQHTKETVTYLVIKEEVHKPWNALGELGELSHSLHRSALAAVEHMDPNLLGQGRTWKQLAPYQTTFCLPECVYIVDHKGLNGGQESNCSFKD